MSDNASPSMDAQIDQVTLGHRFVSDIFGIVPKYAWHIDPFVSARAWRLLASPHSQSHYD